MSMDGAVSLILSIKRNPKSKMEEIDISVSDQTAFARTRAHAGGTKSSIPPISAPTEGHFFWGTTWPSFGVLLAEVATPSITSWCDIPARSSSGSGSRNREREGIPRAAFVHHQPCSWTALAPGRFQNHRIFRICVVTYTRSVFVSHDMGPLRAEGKG